MLERGRENVLHFSTLSRSYLEVSESSVLIGTNRTRADLLVFLSDTGVWT